MNTTTHDEPRYVLGHAEQERERLERQGAFLRPLTRALLLRAGLRPGMRVCDLGCGVGDVTLLAAEIVGPTGSVLGVDREAAALAQAQSRAAARGCAHARFVAGDEHTLAREGPFDAAVGRLVLIHQRDVEAVVQAAVRAVRPGGVVAFHEVDLDAGHWSSAPNPLLAQLWRHVDGLVEHGVFPRELARRVQGAMESAGLRDLLVTREGPQVRGDDRAANAWITGFARSIAAPVQRLGIARPDDAPIDALLARVTGDAALARSFNVPAFLMGAHGVVPDAS